MKKLLGLTCGLVLCGCAHKPPPTPKAEIPAPAAAAKRVETPEFWRADGQAALAGLKKPVAGGAHARNVILFIGDGMGLSTVTAARILQGQMRDPPGPGEENLLAFESFPATALVKTYNVDQQTPEAAGATTAVLSGLKTRAAAVGLDQVPLRGQCREAFGHEAASLVEQAKDAGLSVGVVSTARITNAVPAAAYAHVSDRDWETDSRMPPDAIAQGCVDIARQLVEFDHHGAIDVAFGGGRLAFLPPSRHDPQDPGRAGVRRDGKDLIAGWLARNPHGRYVWSGGQLKGLDWKSVSGPVLGLFAPDNMSFEADRREAADDQPTLSQMTAAAIAGLARNPKGYVLVVSAGGIDRAHHAGNAARALIDTIELSNAVAKAAELTKASDTLILVTADHGHTLTLGGYAKRGDPILGLAHDEVGAPLLDGQGRPYTTLAYANGPGPRDGETPPADAATASIDYRQAAAVPMTAESHSGEDVPLYARGPGAQWVHGAIEQHTIYWIMLSALDGLAPKAAQAPKHGWMQIPKVPLPKVPLPKVPFIGGGKAPKA